MTVIRLVQGDLVDKRLVRLDGVSTLATVSTVVPKVRRSNGRGASVTLAAVVDDAAAKTIEVNFGHADWLAGLTDVADVAFDLEYEVTFLDGSKLTWPSGPPDTVIVRPDQ